MHMCQLNLPVARLSASTSYSDTSTCICILGPNYLLRVFIHAIILYDEISTQLYS